MLISSSDQLLSRQIDIDTIFEKSPLPCNYSCYFSGFGSQARRCNRADTLQLHKQVHNKEKPYNCQLCGVGFSWPSALSRHRRRFHLQNVAVKHGARSKKLVKSKCPDNSVASQSLISEKYQLKGRTTDQSNAETGMIYCNQLVYCCSFYYIMHIS